MRVSAEGPRALTLKTTFLSVLLVVLLSPATETRAESSAPGPVPAGASDPSDELQLLHAEIEKIEFDSEVAQESLLAQYLSRLELLRQGAQGEGDLLGVMAVEREVTRVKAARAPAIPAGGPPSDLPALARTYSEGWARLQKVRTSLRADAIARRNGALEVQMKSLMQAGKVEEARGIALALQHLKNPNASPLRTPDKTAAVAASKDSGTGGSPTRPKIPLPAAFSFLEGARFYTYSSGNTSDHYRGRYNRWHLTEPAFQPEGDALALRLPAEKTTHWKILLGREPLAPGDEWEVEASGLLGFQLTEKADPINSLIAFDGKKTRLHRYRIRRTKDGAQFWVDGVEVTSPIRKGNAERDPPAFARADLYPCLKVRTEDKPVLHKVAFTAGTGAP